MISQRNCRSDRKVFCSALLRCWLLFNMLQNENLYNSGILFSTLYFVTSFFTVLFVALDMCTTNCSHFLHCESRQGLYHCKCQAGFSGPHCDINIDDCSSNPCIHGKCVDGINRYDCECSKGYWGTNCEKEIINEEGWRIIKSFKSLSVQYNTI